MPRSPPSPSGAACGIWAISVWEPSAATWTMRPVSLSLTSADPSSSRARPQGETRSEPRSATTLTPGGSAEGVAGVGPASGVPEEHAAKASGKTAQAAMAERVRIPPLCVDRVPGATWAMLRLPNVVG